MKLRWIIPLVVLLPWRLYASEPDTTARVATVVINPSDITPLHLRPGFLSTIRMPEEINSIALGNRDAFAADHSAGEPLYVYVRPLTNAPAESNLVIATKSGLHVELELISAGDGGSDQPIDFLIDYRASQGFMISSDNAIPPQSPLVHLDAVSLPAPTKAYLGGDHNSRWPSIAALDVEFALQTKINAPDWTKWTDQPIETSIGDIREWNNEMMLSYSIYNNSDKPIEILPPQIQFTEKMQKKKKKNTKSLIADQLEIKDCRLSITRIEPGKRADGALVFDRPNFKQSAEKLFLQIEEADQVDRPILVPLPFTPPIPGRKEINEYEPQ